MSTIDLMNPLGFLVMGVSGSGKTVLGRLLADRLGWDFFDADDFHPPENVAKMTAGIPLDDSDRAPWLASLNQLLLSSLKADTPCVLSCSALKERYRQVLMQGCDGVRIIYLKGGYDLILTRMAARAGHYMKPDMLKSQFDILEEPQDAYAVDVSMPVSEIVDSIMLACFSDRD